MSRRTLWILFAVVVVSVACYQRAERSPYSRWFAEVMETIDRQYVEPVDNQKLFEGALRGMVGRLDDYSSFLPRREKSYFEESLDQQYGGIGIEVGLDGPKKQLVVMNARVGMPAYKAGVLAGDRIVAIEGKSTDGFEMQDAVDSLRGKPGTEVTVSVQREGHEQPLDFHLVRSLIKVDSVLGDLRQEDGSWNFFLPGDGRIGYIRINSFGESTVGEFEAAMKWLTQRNCQGLILDLRNNPGGLLAAAERICDLFVPAGSVIVSTRGRHARERDRYVASGNGPYQKLPLVVMVDGRSASASEIVAACLQDHDRAKVVGERSFGKGTVQNVIPVEGGRSLLKLTIASYWRPSGKNIHRMGSSKETDEWGVKPDAECEVKLDDKKSAEWQDTRRKRDAMQKPNEPQASTGAPPVAAAGSPVEFDPQLQRAVQVLEQKFTSPPPEKSKAT